MEVDFRPENLPPIPLQPPELFMAAAPLDEESQDASSLSLSGSHLVLSVVWFSSFSAA